ncbi:MAG: 2Fe-2S iron-sulfur cluster binding domain-containing protein [Acidimicrobiales bacterium]|nr:2Fe-2S iron-sulfur cluster binding domain-containing protein [Acidimicrobiales bacterium]
MTLSFSVDGREVSVADDGASLLEVLRDRLGLRSAKDGCSPQGQCGCCTVLVDGAPRVSCVTPARRVAGRSVTTLEGLGAAERDDWAERFCATGASQCGFCTPGIIVRLSGLRAKGVAPDDEAAVERALAAHLCRCTGWRTIVEAYGATADEVSAAGAGRDLDAASRRAALEGGVPQQVAPAVALGRAGFADDTAPADALVAVRAADGEWVVGETLSEARERSGKRQGRRTTAALGHPVDVPEGEWAATLRTTWVEPAYLEPDASWCAPGGAPTSPLANGGAFGGKSASEVGAVARRLADEHGRPVRVLLSREDTVRLGPKRPPVAGGADASGHGVLRVARTPGIADAVAAVAPGLTVEQVAIVGPHTSAALRAAGWAEAAVLVGAATGVAEVRSPGGATAEAEINPDGLRVRVACGDPLDEVVLRSYCIGAAHMALGWVTSEGLVVDDDGEVHDLTIRSFGVLRAADTPHVEVELDGGTGAPVNGSDAVFAAVALAVWRHQGLPPAWPTGVALSAS